MRRLVFEMLGGSGDDREGRLGPLVLVHLNIVIYALCFWINQPVLPFLSKELGADGKEWGALQSSVSFMALIGSGVMGRITDEYGVKFSLVLSQLGSVLMYGLTSQATNLTILFISRVPAVLQHAMLCSQAAISQLTSAESRPKAMGRLSLSYGVGMVLGSPIGGMISKHFGNHMAALCATIGSLGILLADMAFLPTLRPEHSENEKSDSITGLNLHKLFEVMRREKVRDLLVVTTTTSLGVGAFRSMFTIFMTTFGMQSQDLGFYLSFVAFVGLITNVFLVGIASKRYGSFQAMLYSCVLLGLFYFAYLYCDSFLSVAIVSIPFTIASSTLYTLFGVCMSLSVSEEESGTSISLSHASRSFIGIISPMIGGYMYDKFGFPGICVFGAFAAFTATIYGALLAASSLYDLDHSKPKATSSKQS